VFEVLAGALSVGHVASFVLAGLGAVSIAGVAVLLLKAGGGLREGYGEQPRSAPSTLDAEAPVRPKGRFARTGFEGGADYPRVTGGGDATGTEASTAWAILASAGAFTWPGGW
jgi:hypothetical protein